MKRRQRPEMMLRAVDVDVVAQLEVRDRPGLRVDVREHRVVPGLREYDLLLYVTVRLNRRMAVDDGREVLGDDDHVDARVWAGAGLVPRQGLAGGLLNGEGNLL